MGPSGMRFIARMTLPAETRAGPSSPVSIVGFDLVIGGTGAARSTPGRKGVGEKAATMVMTENMIMSRVHLAEQHIARRSRTRRVGTLEISLTIPQFGGNTSPIPFCSCTHRQAQESTRRDIHNWGLHGHSIARTKAHGALGTIMNT